MRKSQLSFNTELQVQADHSGLFRANKIICTIGPTTQSVAVLKQLIAAGMNVARMNFSHGSHEYHKATIDNVRQAALEMQAHVGIALDTKGPEIRTGLFTGGEALIAAGSEVLVTCDEAFKECGTGSKFYVDYKNIVAVTDIGGTVFIDDGVLNLEILEKVDDVTLKCVARNQHVLSNRKGVNLPKAAVDLPAVSEKDRQDLAFGAQNGVDFIFASFIRSADQVREVRACLDNSGGAASAVNTIQVISKIENWQGVDHIDEIIDASDGIMVARGDLGVEIPAEKVVFAQKMIISKCNVAGKTAICATQMLDSMTTNPRPTRAEVSDVANAVLDGADCVMLSGETAKGKYPVETVAYMARICVEAQAGTWNRSVMESIKDVQPLPMSPEEAICASAANTVQELGARAVVVLSNTGRSARLMSKYRPYVPIFCAAQLHRVCRAMTIVRGAIPVFYDTEKLGDDKDREKRVALAIEHSKSIGICREGDLVIAVHADHKTKGFANQTRALYVH